MSKTSRIPAAACLAIGLALSACSGVPLLTPYRIDVQQGNVVTQEMVSALKPGMSRDQVKFVLGTPLLTDMFHANRWDYVFRMQRGNGKVEERRIAVFFENDVLLRVDGDVAAKADPATGSATSKAPVEKDASADRGFFGRLRDKLGL